MTAATEQRREDKPVVKGSAWLFAAFLLRMGWKSTQTGMITCLNASLCFHQHFQTARSAGLHFILTFWQPTHPSKCTSATNPSTKEPRLSILVSTSHFATLWCSFHQFHLVNVFSLLFIFLWPLFDTHPYVFPFVSTHYTCSSCFPMLFSLCLRLIF